MKVCLVGPVFPYRGGIAHFTSMLAREFSTVHDTLVVNFERLYPSLLFPGRTQYDTSDSPIRIDSRRLIDSVNPVSWLSTGRAIARYSPDAIVFQWWHPFFAPAYNWVARAARRRVSTRTVFLCHNVLPHEASIFDRALIQWGFSAADAFLVQSNEDLQNLKRLRRNVTADVNPHPIYDCFDAGRWTRETAREVLGVGGPVLLFFGYVRKYKGLDVLLRAMAELPDGLGATLLVVGEFYDDRSPYDRLIKDLGIADSIRFDDRYVPNEEVEKFFKAADLVVLPYRSATQSGIVQTAFSFEVPVVVTAVGGLPDVVEEGRTGFIVPSEDPGAIARAVGLFFETAAGEAMRAAIGAGIDRFSWRRCREKLERLIELSR